MHLPASARAPWHQRHIDEVAQLLRTDLAKGLSPSEAESRAKEYGSNKLSEAPPRHWWLKLLSQFNQLVIWILIAATLLSAILGDWLEAGAILAIVLLNALLGFFQEQKAEKALSSLQKLSSPIAKAIRGGSLRTVAAATLVPGDVIELEAGDHIPADARLVTTFGLKTQEAALTGESTPVEKDGVAVLPENVGIAERANMVFTGTTVVGGKGRAVVTATGMNTELGRIAEFLTTEEREPTPLQKRLAELGRVLIIACLVLVAIIFILQLLRGESLAQTFLIAVSLAVAAVPEGLPAVVTIALAMGLQRMVKRNALIRRLASVETLGSVTVICSDKTGTLTHNEMMVTEIVTGPRRYRVTGTGYEPVGEFLALAAGPEENTKSWPVNPRNDPDLAMALTIGLWCNNARLDAPTDPNQRWRIFGDPTEGALIVAATKAGLERGSDRAIIHEIPFDSNRKLMSMVVKNEQQRAVIYTKGAPELLLERCAFEHRAGKIVPLSRERRARLLQQSSEMANRALRLLALAHRDLDNDSADYLELDLILAGLVGMIDRPREEARAAVAKCQSAGIRPVMITGDHPATALAVAQELKITRDDDTAITGLELDGLSEQELLARVENLAVYARVSPEHKLRVVQALKANGQVVAMTGDGVNDAPAMKMADIGIAMGITGTDVTKEASDIVLMGDNFASIVNAVEEGRGIYDNIQKFVHYLLSTNASEIALVLFAALIGWPVPLLPIQILWINLVTDGLPALALAMEKPEPDVMSRPPRPPKEAFFTRQRGAWILIHGSAMATVIIGGFAYAYSRDGAGYAQATAFYTTTFAQLFFSFACRSQRYTLPQLGVFTNPYLLAAILVSGMLQISLLWFPLTRNVFFKTAPHFGSDWVVIFLLALAPVSLVEITKITRSRGWFRGGRA
ncbi:MAG TPA: cation-translocating P-type ATPase [Candidatus Udaeobacter sp.]|nr:cation-translocating P-type ATPase [Candidatus Udaeobacter sp.]